MAFDSPAEGDLLAFARAHWRSELQLGQIVLHGDDAGAGRHGADVQHEDLSLGQLRHLSLPL